MQPTLAQIWVFPIKSLDGVQVREAEILPGGSLKCDREFALVDPDGHFINGKRTPLIHRLRATYALKQRQVTLQWEGSTATFHLEHQRRELATWLSKALNQPVHLVQNRHHGFPDDTDSPGPTVVSVASLETVANWFPDLSTEQVRQRFRTNLEIDQVPPFWEDQLFAETDAGVPFHIGGVTLWGMNPCQRCVVPTRDPWTGTRYQGFQKQFVAKRRELLPPGVARSRFNHFYRFTLNTRIRETEAGKILRVTDQITTA